MKKTAITITDIAIVILVGLLTAWMFYQSAHRQRTRGIPPLVTVTIHQRPNDDSLRHALQLISDELDEMDYFLRSHQVEDEGYNLVAEYNTKLSQRHSSLEALLHTDSIPYTTRDTIPASQRTQVALKVQGGYWKAGNFHLRRPLSGKAITIDAQHRLVRGIWDHDTIVVAWCIDSLGTYFGQMKTERGEVLYAHGQGVFDGRDHSHYEGFFANDRRHGFGFESSPHHALHIGQWKEGRFLGERLRYTTERVYGIDISRHQHEKGRSRFGIDWRHLRITSLGKKHPSGGLTFPVSFAYIKATEGTTIQNRYFARDYAQAHRYGIHVGAYNFFSMRTSAQDQAIWFLRHAIIRQGDFPPVLDVEPSDAQIAAIGGDDELMRRIRIWMETIERHTGKRPILYVNQMFIRNHMRQADDIKKKYNVWIARYGEYKPDVRLAFWQLSPNGRVTGITGDVDINVFNGYQGQFADFVRTGYHQ